ncbi:MAG: TIGR02221 family CRISPR-associated protein [Crocosphaera sp.]|nr:TIGR02221 family CRISPR-associated protein [Crocosphaera sp.]
MAKILISPLGVGGRFKEQTKNREGREYQNTTYKIDDKYYHNSRFISSVLYKHFDLDGVIFIGTVKSMWEAVYEYFCEENQIDVNTEYWWNLVDTIDQCNYNSNLDILDLSILEEILGTQSQCILIKYGITEEELWENFERVIEVINSLSNRDEIYIDITHAFRSLSVLQFLSITFIQDLLIDKEITIKGIYYGMLEVARPSELGFTPIINLMPFFEMISWMQGAYSFKNFGNGYLISQLLHQQNQLALSKNILQLSEAINLNYLPTIQQRAIDLKSSLHQGENTIPFKYLKHIPEDFVNQFSSPFSRQSDFQIELAKWYFDHKHYAAGYVTLAESIITYLCELNHLDFKNYDDREKMKKMLGDDSHKQRELSYLFNQKINRIRNAIAHASYNKKRPSYLDAINNANTYYHQIKNIFNSRTLGEIHHN